MHYNIKLINDKYDFEITGASFIGEPVDGTMLFMTHKVKRLLPNMEGHKNCLVFVENGMEIDENLMEDNCFMFSDDPQREYAKLAITIDKEEKEKNKKRKHILTQEGYYKGEGVKIGADTIIEAGCFIDHDVVIGNNCYIKSGTVIRNAIIGDNFECFERVTIGTDCFFIAEDENNNEFRIPSFGKVIIGNNVCMGAGTVIERGFNRNTRINDYVKLDANVAIGHDCLIHEHVKATAGATIAGFVEIKQGAYIAMNATIKQRLTIGENATVGMGAAVITNVKDGITVFGNPTKKYDFGFLK